MKPTLQVGSWCSARWFCCRDSICFFPSAPIVWLVVGLVITATSGCLFICALLSTVVCISLSIAECGQLYPLRPCCMTGTVGHTGSLQIIMYKVNHQVSWFGRGNHSRDYVVHMAVFLFFKRGMVTEQSAYLFQMHFLCCWLNTTAPSWECGQLLYKRAPKRKNWWYHAGARLQVWVAKATLKGEKEADINHVHFVRAGRKCLCTFSTSPNGSRSPRPHHIPKRPCSPQWFSFSQLWACPFQLLFLYACPTYLSCRRKGWHILQALRAISQGLRKLS